LEDFFQTVQKPKHLDLFQAATSPPDFQTIVSEAIDVIHHHDIDKVVLSRYSDTQLPRDFDPFVSFNDACKTYPNAFVYILYKPDHGLWLGATPETLLSIEDSRIFKTVSLAGTQRLDENQSLSSVAWTQKEIEEQAMVSRYIIDCFKKIRLREFDENGPKTVKAGNLAHLKTEYRVDLNDVNMPNLGSVMLDLLHPTSAVCGMPLHPALQFIRDRENYDRELYSGFLGPVNIKGLTHLFVNLRCMKITNDTGRFYAGAGITGDSDPEREFIETELKMQTLKRIIFP
ncbi:MAG: chorismate-binding protein, partial [Cyclobacteriaceae bacterium]|nr:chorismate-binding protein [Cyclobacteriaceae bacterium]